MTKRILYILIGAIVLILLAIGVCVYALLPTITSAMAANQTPTPTPTVSATPTQKTNTTAKILKQYAPDIKNQISQGLHLTYDQLTAQLKSDKTLSEFDTTQNLS